MIEHRILSLKDLQHKVFYKLMTVMGVKSVYNHADFRLMSARAVEQLGNYKERNLFFKRNSTINWI